MAQMLLDVTFTCYLHYRHGAVFILLPAVKRLESSDLVQLGLHGSLGKTLQTNWQQKRDVITLHVLHLLLTALCCLAVLGEAVDEVLM